MNTNCNIYNNNFSNLPNMNFNNNGMMGESLTIHSLIDMHGQNNFNAIPRIACMLRNNKRIINEPDPETPIELALILKKYDIAKYLKNKNAKVNFNFNTNNLNHIRHVIETGIKPTKEQLRLIIRKLLYSKRKNNTLLEFFATEYMKRKQQNKAIKQLSQAKIRSQARELLKTKEFRKLPKNLQLKILAP